MSELEIICDPEKTLDFGGDFCESTVVPLKIQNTTEQPILFKVGTYLNFKLIYKKLKNYHFYGPDHLESKILNILAKKI